MTNRTPRYDDNSDDRIENANIDALVNFASSDIFSGYPLDDTDLAQLGSGLSELDAGTDANKPTAGTAGRFYLATDTNILYYDNGSSWSALAGAGDSTARLPGTVYRDTVDANSVDTDELNNAIYVSKYGADSQAIADAIADASAGGTVVVDEPDGGSITLDAQQTFTKRVTLLWLSDATVADNTITSISETVLRFDGAGTKVVQLSGEIDGNGANNTGSLIQLRADDGELRGLQVRNAPNGIGIDMGNAEDATITDCTVIDPYKHAIRDFGTAGGTIENCRVRNPNNRTNNYMIYLTGPDKPVVDGCTVKGGTNSRQGISTDTTVTEPRITDCTVRGDFTERSVNWEGCTGGVLDVTVTGNTLNEGVLASDPQDCELRITATDIDRYGLRVINGDDNTIKLGAVARCGNETDDGANACGVFLQGINNTVIDGGQVTDCDRVAIKIDGSGANATPTDNSVRNVTATDTGSGDQEYGVETTGDPSGTVVINNDLRGNVTAGLNLNGTGTITDPVNQDQTNNHNIV